MSKEKIILCFIDFFALILSTKRLIKETKNTPFHACSGNEP